MNTKMAAKVSRDVQDIFNRMTVDHPWLARKFRPDTLMQKLEEWRTRITFKAAQTGITLDDEEIFSHLKASYLRLISFDTKNGKVESRILSVLGKIRKQRISQKIYRQSGKRVILDGRKRGCGLSKLKSRTRLWERMIKAHCQGISDQDIFRFFKIRYLHVSDERFTKVEIKKGIRNTRAYLEKRSRLERLFIKDLHPQYKALMNLPIWKFKRNHRSLLKAIKACKELRLNFPPIKGSTTQRELRHLLKQSGNGITKEQEMLYKLVIYFQGMTLKQIQFIYETYLSSNGWQVIDVEESMNRLVQVGLLKRASIEDGWYYVRVTREIQIEILLENWIERLRRDITIGTGEALAYLPRSFASHSLNYIEQKDIPLATQKIWRDRRAYLKGLYVTERDPQAGYFLRKKRSELDQAVQRVSGAVKAHQNNTLTIPEVLQRRFSFYMGQELKRQDLDVLKLIYNLGTASYEQLASILRKTNKGKIGFYLRSALKRLCEYGLIEYDDQLIYRIKEPAREG